MIYVLVSAALWQLQVNYEHLQLDGFIRFGATNPETPHWPEERSFNVKHCYCWTCLIDVFVCLCVVSKQMASMCHSVPMLKVEEWPLPGDSLTGDTVRALIDRVSDVYCNSVATQLNQWMMMYFKSPVVPNLGAAPYQKVPRYNGGVTR